MRFLFVGDPHARVSNLQEMEKLVDFLANMPERDRFDFVLLAGDLFNDHAVVRLEVAQFWRSALTRLSSSYRETVVLVGNHDMAGSRQMEKGTNALHLVTKEINNLELVDRPTGALGTFAAIPYTSNEEEFVAAANELYKDGFTDLLVCHQTFNGAMYDNGFYAPGGFDASRVPQRRIISGHIHTSQEFGKVWYPGTPRWENRNDANLDKGVWDVEISGEEMKRTLISTKGAVTPIVELVIKEGEPLPATPSGVKLYVELVGSSEWIKKTKETYRGVASIKATHKDTKLKLGSQGRGMTLEEYIDKHFDTTLVSKDALKEAVKSL
jgi:DNA repair exonuclease SbcCD nuclease subunit